MRRRWTWLSPSCQGVKAKTCVRETKAENPLINFGRGLCLASAMGPSRMRESLIATESQAHTDTQLEKDDVVRRHYSRSCSISLNHSRAVGLVHLGARGLSCEVAWLNIR